MKTLLDQSDSYISETLPQSILVKYKLVAKKYALRYLHAPQNLNELTHSHRRLKFEELFYNQLRLLKLSLVRKHDYEGQIFQNYPNHRFLQKSLTI